MGEIMLNLSAWIERRADNLKPYADHIIHSVKAYEAEIERLRRPEAAQVRVKGLRWDHHDGVYPTWVAYSGATKTWYKIDGGSCSAKGNFPLFIDKQWTGKKYMNPEQAKAAAQADYESRIRAALEPVDDGDLDERMKAAGMIPLSELLESHGPMEKFKQHAAVATFDDFVWWIKSQQKQFMAMRMRYELGDKDKGDDLFEWVFAHAAVYDQVATQLRALAPAPEKEG